MINITSTASSQFNACGNAPQGVETGCHKRGIGSGIRRGLKLQPMRSPEKAGLST
ncbi:hypothetical protein [Nostoc sp. FACHB-110]|uniref:hypothetical protein n=1 Tax=Nostoc sp. FACHB-110 TaxID=2692834 RepID=UPI00168859B2|nr:hypothetical protein [Nostoc sp. FACHB-110]MBD2440539.1 hypothetical protein [Nostoc sp. FACHB-110]